MNRESIRIALHGINANRLRSFLTMLGIMIGVASVIVLVAVGAGSAAKNRRQLESLGSNTLTIVQGGFGFGNRGGTRSSDLRLTDADVTALADPTQAPSVAAVVPIVNLRANNTVSFAGASATPAQVLGTNELYPRVRSYSVGAGQFFTADDIANHTKVAVVGTTVAKNLLGASADPNTLVGEQIKVGSVELSVIGVLKSKGTNGVQDQDDLLVIPYTTVRNSLGGAPRRVDQIVVQARNRAAADSAQSEITTMLVTRHKSATANSYLVLNQASN